MRLCRNFFRKRSNRRKRRLFAQANRVNRQVATKRRFAKCVSFLGLGRNAERFNIGRLTESGNKKYSVQNFPPDIYISQYYHITKKDTQLSVFSDSGDVLLSQAVAHQVSSALKSLTTVFGMGTGVTSLLLPPNVCQTPCGVLTHFVCVSKTESEKFQKPYSFFCSLWLTP